MIDMYQEASIMAYIITSFVHGLTIWFMVGSAIDVCFLTLCSPLYAELLQFLAVLFTMTVLSGGRKGLVALPLVLDSTKQIVGYTHCKRYGETLKTDRQFEGALEHTLWLDF